MSIKISELPSATEVNDADLIPIVQSGTTKQATASMIKTTLPTIATSITSSSTNNEVAGAKAVYDYGIIKDTGWVDMSSYLNTTNFAIRSSTSTFYPRARRIGNVVYWIGQIICTTAPSSKNGTILTGLPEWIKPDGAENRFTRSGMMYQTTRIYNLQVGENAQNVNFVTAVEGTNIATTSDWQGYDLTTISGYITDTAFPDNL